MKPTFQKLLLLGTAILAGMPRTGKDTQVGKGCRHSFGAMPRSASAEQKNRWRQAQAVMQRLARQEKLARLAANNRAANAAAAARRAGKEAA